MSRWFRVYDEMLDDPKVQRLEAGLFRVLVNLWCLASRHDGRLPPTADLGFSLRLDPAALETALAALAAAGFLDTDPADGSLRPHGWDRRQYVSDRSTERVRAHRRRRAAQGADAAPPAPDPARDPAEEPRHGQRPRRPDRSADRPDPYADRCRDPVLQAFADGSLA